MERMILKSKKKCKKALPLFLALVLIVQIMAPAIVSAVSYKDGNIIALGGNPTVNGTTFEYANGDVTVKKNGTLVNTTSFSVEQDDVIVIELLPEEGYFAKVHNDDEDYDEQLTDNTLSFTIGQEANSTISLTPSFSDHQGPNEDGPNDPPVEDLKFDFTINGESFTNVTIGDAIVVPDDFNMNSLEEFYVTKIVDGDRRTYTYEEGEYSLDLLDNQNRRILESHFNKKSNNYAVLRVEAHAIDIQAADLEEHNKTVDDYFSFYITALNFIKEDFRGVEVSTENMPDNYDFTVWNGADLGETTLSNPAVVTAYYGAEDITFDSLEENPVTSIELVEGQGVPASAVEIDNDTATVSILSNFYNKVLVKVELQDGTEGYVQINRIGIFIGELDVGQTTFYHGAVNNTVNGNLNVQTNKQRLVAVFYHENTTTYEDYDLIVNITYTNGETEVVVATGVGDVDNMSGDIVGSDYILWSGDSLDTIVKLSVTAVNKGATTNTNTFGGATFGSGDGVEWTRS